MRIPFRFKLKEAVAEILFDWRRKDHKVLFCRPQGGLNDILSQIQHCRSYALLHNRELWIDTRRSGLHTCISDYFQSSRMFGYGSPPHILDDDSCFPPFLQGRLKTYESAYDQAKDNFIDKQTLGLLSFDFNTSYQEQILVHEQCGGGLDAIKALRHLRFKPYLQDTIRKLLSELGDYDAIHIRNTDLTTDYISFFKQLKDLPTGKIIVCTDDHHCLRYAKDFWQDRLLVVHEVPDTGGRPLHFSNNLDRHKTNVNTLMDLMILASAKRFHSCRTRQGRTSGFSLLARSLRANPGVIRKLLNG